MPKKILKLTLDSVARNNKKTATLLSIQFDNLLRNPLSINPEMTKVTAENTAKAEQACSKLKISVEKLNADLTSTTDYIVSNLRQDTILENSANKSELDTIKDLLIQQNIRTEGLKSDFSIQSIMINAVSQINYPGQVETTAQINSPPPFNNPYMDETISQKDRDIAPHLSNSHQKAAPQHNSRNSQPQFNNSRSSTALQKQENHINSICSMLTMSVVISDKLSAVSKIPSVEKRIVISFSWHEFL
jgi:hypothetical protein